MRGVISPLSEQDVLPTGDCETEKPSLRWFQRDGPQVPEKDIPRKTCRGFKKDLRLPQRGGERVCSYKFSKENVLRKRCSCFCQAEGMVRPPGRWGRETLPWVETVLSPL